MKKSIIFILLTVLILGVFTACNGDVLDDLLNGGSEPGPAPVEILYIDANTTTLTGGKTYTIAGDVINENRLSIDGNDPVTILLPDGKTLTAIQGITVTEGQTLIIDEDGTIGTEIGKLIAGGEYTTPERAAGIGGVNESGKKNAGTITIKGGTVIATGGFRGSGIGGGEDGNGGTVTIKGGTVTAIGVSGGAGIGGGYDGDGEYGGDGGTVNISGGTVTAISLEYGAGIGGGYEGAGGTVNISGGTVKATGGESAAGIGGGDKGAGGTVTIDGGTVTATGGDSAAGIGGGYMGDGGDVTIKGGTVTAKGGHNAAGIGGGVGGAGGTVIITGGTVTATGGEDDSTGGNAGAGIGGGRGGAGGAVTIKGGTVTATGGSGAYDDGSGIGVGIGAGNGSSEHGTLKIIGAGYVLTGGSASADTILIGPVEEETEYPDTSSHPRCMVASVISEIKDSTSAITLKSGVYTTDKTDAEVVVSERITVEGNVFLLLPDGKTLTASKGITVSSGNTLVIDKYGSTATGTGTLTANGTAFEAGIGGTDTTGKRDGGTVTINGGIVTATGGKGGAGIGGCAGQGAGGTVTINGGTVIATGGSADDYYLGSGAGIGGGYNCAGGTVAINGGTVTATGGSGKEGYSGAGAGIGAGGNSSSHGTLTIGTGVHVYKTGETTAYDNGPQDNVTTRYQNMTVNNFI